MEPEHFQDFLTNRYFPALDHYKKRAFRNQQQYKLLQSLMLILSSITTLAVGLAPFLDFLALKVSALVCSFVVSVIAGLLRSFSYREKWAFYNKMFNDLQNEYDLYSAQANAYSDSDDKERLFVSHIRKLLNEGMSSMAFGTVPRTQTPQVSPSTK